MILEHRQTLDTHARAPPARSSIISVSIYYYQLQNSNFSLNFSSLLHEKKLFPPNNTPEIYKTPITDRQ